MIQMKQIFYFKIVVLGSLFILKFILIHLELFSNSSSIEFLLVICENFISNNSFLFLEFFGFSVLFVCNMKSSYILSYFNDVS